MIALFPLFQLGDHVAKKVGSSYFVDCGDGFAVLYR